MSIGDPDLDVLMASTSQLRTESHPVRSFNRGVDASEGVTSAATFEFSQESKKVLCKLLMYLAVLRLIVLNITLPLKEFTKVILADRTTFNFHDESPNDIPTISLEEVSSIPLTDLEIVVGHCREDLSYLDYFGSCDGIHFHVFSPCGGMIPEFKYIQDCVTVHQDVKDCGRETYFYFDYIIKRYDTLPKQVAFFQGDAHAENPEIIQDLQNRMDGVSYAGLSRIVREGWHMKNDTVRSSLQDRLSPGLRSQQIWITAWRSQFIASRSAIKRHSQSAYVELNKAICEKKCLHVQCALEVWLGPLFGCAPYLFDDKIKCEKETLDWALSVSNTTSEGEIKGFNSKTLVTAQTELITCGNRTIFYSSQKSTNNGILVCTEE